MSTVPETITLTEDGYTVPVIEVLTGRTFLTGKSGSGKSNSASVIAEELLEYDLPLLIIDTDGEYWGLKEQYELLHVGADPDECDREIDVSDAVEVADIALHDNIPVILDVSGFHDEAVTGELVYEVVTRLFAQEKEAQRPFLLIVEEIHEFLPERGGSDDLADMLIRIAKRGRKRGLGLCGISQRPASVDKDFITQCDWLVWHRLTWSNDIKVVREIMGPEVANQIDDLSDGEAFLMTDWDEEITRITFRRKRTFDAGATPGLEDLGRPTPGAVDDDMKEAIEPVQVADGQSVSVAAELKRKERQIANLEQKLQSIESSVDNGQPPVEGDGGTEEPIDITSLDDGSAPNDTQGSEFDPLAEFSHLMVYVFTMSSRLASGILSGSSRMIQALIAGSGRWIDRGIDRTRQLRLSLSRDLDRSYTQLTAREPHPRQWVVLTGLFIGLVVLTGVVVSLLWLL